MRPSLIRHIRLSLPVAAAVAAALLVPTGRPALADVTVNQVYPVPDNGMFVLDGHGFGHGRGLSQWGAEGAAERGVQYQSILSAYYPGTTLTSVPSPDIRVQLAEFAPASVPVVAASDLVATDDATRTRYYLPTRTGSAATISYWRVVPYNGYQCLSWYSGGAWHQCWTPPGSKTYFFKGPLEFWRWHFGPVTGLLPDGGTRAYRGSLRAVTVGTGLAAVNVLPLESYVYGVVPRESPSSWAPAALEAQAVAARSYALYHVLYDQSNPGLWDICDTTACQVYGGYSGEAASSNQAVDATRGQVLEYQSRVAFTEFSSSNGGYSAPGDQPYLSAHSDPWDAIASPYHDWSAQVSASTIEGLYPQVGTLRDITVLTRNGYGDWGGRIQQVRLDGSAGSVTMYGYQLSWALGLLDEWWRVDPSSYAGDMAPGVTPVALWSDPQHFSLFAVSGSRSLTERSWTPSGWSPARNLGGVIVGRPAATLDAAGDAVVVVRGSDSGLWMQTISPAGVASGWRSLGGRLSGSPAVVGLGDGRLVALVTGTDRTLWARTFSGGSWSGWVPLGGRVVAGSGPAAASPGQGRYSVFVHGTDNRIWERDYGPAGLGRFEPVGEPLAGDPAAASTGAGTVTVFARQSGGSLAAGSGAPGAVTGWHSLGGRLASDPAAAAVTGHTDVFVWGVDSRIWQSTDSGSGFGSWKPIL